MAVDMAEDNILSNTLGDYMSDIMDQDDMTSLTDFNLRCQVYRVLRKWEASDLVLIGEGSAAVFLTDLLDAKTLVSIKMTDKHRDTCRALIGPHGWAVYNMLRARK